MDSPLKTIISLRVRYGETDQMGIVHHVNYLHYFEVARTELLRECGFSYKSIEEKGYLLVVTESQCRYLKPARYDDELRVETWLSLLGNVRIHFQYRILRGEEVLAKGYTKLGCISPERVPTAIPEELREKMKPYVEEPSS